MPSYAKYIKEIVSNKKKLEEFATVHLNEECSAILQSKLPPKLMDPGSFSIPCTIGNTVVDKCLCDLGASINLMPLTLFRKLGIAEMKPTTISLQLADRSVKYPQGVEEDILVKVGKFYFPADFLILDMGNDTDTSLILGRPFLLTRVIIDMPLGKLIFRVGTEKEEFSISKAVKFPSFDESCHFVDAIEKLSKEAFALQENLRFATEFFRRETAKSVAKQVLRRNSFRRISVCDEKVPSRNMATEKFRREI
ncbi:uncharacterized protein LOC115999433 [Ipomoea triloba]|uniref:uncharacterized protein LOC115999433 n=1 Tax=Ipomoea triloba TaxID=35885 RepID=UPI00125CF3EA|nr:uncharacterized protein LOC115999433 [Ipomoea triloba]